MNMVGNLGGALAGWSTGLVLQKALDTHATRLGLSSAAQLHAADKAAALWHGYQINFLIFAVVYVFGVICWLHIDATKPLLAEQDG